MLTTAGWRDDCVVRVDGGRIASIEPTTDADT